MDQKTLSREERREKTELILSNIYNLPAMPKIMLEVNKLLENPSTSITDLSKVISQDQALVSKILSISNSPLYGLPRKVSTIDFAILIIGFNDIKNIVIALSMIDTFKNKSDKNLNRVDFWTHSILTASLAKRVSDDLGYRIGGEAFVCGLLHDLGISILHKYFHNAFIEIRKGVEQEDKNFRELEEATLGLGHNDIGGFLGRKWNLPFELIDAVVHHHAPASAEENDVLASIVHLADYMTNYFNPDKYYWDNHFELDKSVMNSLRFPDEGNLQVFIESYKDLCSLQAELLKGLN